MSAEMVTTARQLAEGAHRGQVDKAGAAYIDHPARVTARVSGLRAEQYTHARRVLRSSATEQERRTMPVCLLCQVELDGVGRTYFDTIEDAMRAFGSYADTRVTIGEHVRKTYVQ